MNASEIIRWLSPELVLLITAFVVLGADLAMRRRDEGRTAAIIALIGLAIALIFTLLLAMNNPSTVVAWTMAIDPYAIFFKVLALISVSLVILSSISFMKGKSRYLGEYYALLVFVALAICVAVSATNLVLVYLGIEFLSITSYILTGFLRNDRRSEEAAIKYFLYGASAGAVMLYGISLVYGATGSTDLVAIGELLKATGPDRLLGIVAIILLLGGFGFKASLVPFHQWAPDTYDGAPTPITAFLSTASKAVGFAVAGRVFITAFPQFMTDWTAILGSMSILTMTVGNLTALKQTSVKRMLAYSSIAQAGYIVLGLAAYNPGADTFTGLNGLMLYLFAYLFTNIGAFFVVLAVEYHAGSSEFSTFKGLSKRAPGLALLMTVFMLSLAGIPPTGGFLGKFYVFAAVVDKRLLILAAIAAVNTIVAAFYYLNVIRLMYFSESEDERTLQLSAGVNTALVISAVMVLFIGIFA
ncbi:MAG: NADH-quinone oxidoreductase subunit N, partial [Chloroflexi bacterium]|nr:NADH-quinone oxidoreductase subunit N [Chloroflexota bacterium]